MTSSDPVRPVVLHSSWRGRLLASLAPTILIGFSLLGIAGVGLRPWPLAFGVIGLVLGAIVLFDYPLWTVFGADGVARRCPLRTERLGWDRIDQLSRPAFVIRVPGAGGSTGLVAQVGSRRYMLTDKMESRAEHQALLRGIATWSPLLAVEATLPPENRAPTWLYKRRRGTGDGLCDLLEAEPAPG
ncbi:MAG: hypothetical protein AAF467_27255 [Actinomycetota bacterium]